MFYDNLKNICKINNTSPTQVLKEINISTGSLGNWKKGVLPNGEIIIRLATHLNVSIDYLLLDKKDQSAPKVADVTIDKLTFDEKSLINTYRELNDDGKTIMLDISKEIWADHPLPIEDNQSKSKSQYYPLSKKNVEDAG